MILSPKAEKPEKLKEFIDELNSLDIAVYFDPQFYMCAFEGSISLGKLESYDAIEKAVERLYTIIEQK